MADAADPIDIYSDLYSPDDMVAKARADAMAQRARGLQGAGLVLSTLTGRRDPTQGALTAMGTQDLGQVTQAVQHRPAMLLQSEQARRAQIQNQAEASPEYAGAMRSLGYEMGAAPGSLENVPGPSLPHIIDPLEKLAGHRLQAAIFGARQSMLGWQLKTLDNGKQVWVNTHTMETRGVGPNGEVLGQVSPPRTPLVVPGVTPATPAPSAPGAAPGSAPKPKAPKLLAPGATPGPAGGSTFYPLFGKQLDKATQAFGADLDPNTKSGNEIGRNQARLNAAIRLRKLVTDENGNVRDMIPPQFVREAALALAQMVNNGGQPAQSLIEELTPKTSSSKVADWAQWLTNHPQDAGQQGFVKLYLESANREAQAAQEALNKAVAARVGKHQRLIKGNPDVARETAAHYGWNIDDKGNLVPQQPAAVASGAAEVSPEDRAALEWLKANPNHKAAAGVTAKLKAKGLL